MAYGRIYLQIIYKRGDNNIPWQLITTHNKFLLIKSCNNKNKSKKETKQTKKNTPLLSLGTIPKCNRKIAVTEAKSIHIYMTVHSPGLVHALQ